MGGDGVTQKTVLFSLRWYQIEALMRRYCTAVSGGDDSASSAQPSELGQCPREFPLAEARYFWMQLKVREALPTGSLGIHDP